MSERSEFGAGLVVCLAKFSEHLANRMAQQVVALQRWQTLSEELRSAKRDEARLYPRGDAAVLINHVESAYSLCDALEMWANGASDHFYDLDRKKAPPSLRKLAALTLDMGHGFTGRTWTWEDWQQIHKLWQQACLALDRRLGVTPDWGEW